MTTDERRQAVALEKIAKATEDFVKLFKVFNQNIVDFARSIQLQEDHESIQKNEEVRRKEMLDRYDPEIDEICPPSCEGHGPKKEGD